MPSARFRWCKLSRVFQSPAGYITPKLQLHATNYQFDAPLTDGAHECQPCGADLQSGRGRGV